MKSKGKKRLGQQEMQFFAFVQLRKKTTVQTGELTEALGLSQIQERKLLSRLSIAGLIARLKRGLYLVPPRIPPGGVWSPSEYLILAELMKAYDDGKYQICGPNTFNMYGFSEQIPNRTYVYNNRIYSDRNIGGVAFVFIRTADERLGGAKAIKTPDGPMAFFSSKARTLMDAVYDWSRFNTLPRAYEWMRRAVRDDAFVTGDLIRITAKYGNVGTIRRVGYFLESLSIDTTALRPLQRKLSKSKVFIPLVPRKPARGKTDRNWGIIDNYRNT